MVGEVAKKILYLAAKNVDVASFQNLLREDPYILDEVSFVCSRNLLHIATMHGQAAVAEVLGTNPQLARNLDSQKSSPLHIAAAKGHVEIARALLLVAPEICWWRDDRGMNPVHIAAMNGHGRVLELLVEANPFPAAEKLDRGQTILHLCVKHLELEALRYLVENLGELVDVEDDDGEMVLHSAVRFKQVEMIEFLVQNHRTYDLPTNSKGKTVQQICKESAPDLASSQISKVLSRRISYSGKPVGFRGKMSDSIMVVVVLIATMAFQAAISPPGGVWQDDSSQPQPRLHQAGEAVMASSRPIIFESFSDANTTAFVSSLITIILLTTGLPYKNILFTMVVLCTIWGQAHSVIFLWSGGLGLPSRPSDYDADVCRTSRRD